MYAIKTLNEINRLLEADQGAAFRRHLKVFMSKMDDAYRDESDPFRSHLGMSIIGRECAREIWYSWRWTTKPQFEGRLIRLFNRGHLEEARFLALLAMIGCKVWYRDDDGNQFHTSDHDGHYGGSLDGVVLGVPDLPDIPCLVEFKTHGDKSFQKLRVEGVRTAKFEHYVQMQQYMGYQGLKAALYMAVNKNDDDLFAEIVHFDPAVFEQYKERAGRLIQLRTAPPRIHESPGWFKCKFCEHSPVCHGDAQPERNCRTCKFSVPVSGGAWMCENPDAPPTFLLSKEKQLEGCPAYEVNPSIKGR